MANNKPQKTDLHLHLDGSLPLGVIPRLAENAGLYYRNEQISELFSVPAGCTSLEDYLACFEHPLKLLQTEENLSIATKALIDELYHENVKIAEIRFAPMLHKQNGLVEEQIIESVLDGMHKGLENCPDMKCGLILCMMVHRAEGENKKTVQMVKKYIEQGVVALDRAGAENARPIADFAPFFQEARRQEIPYTIHAGECGSWQNVKSAIDLGASRIGHGIAAAWSPEVLDLVRCKEIPLEICVTSNLQTRAVPTGKKHPVKELLDAGVKVTINTDNRTVSGTNLDKEYNLLKNQYEFTDEDILKVQQFGTESSFIQDI